MRLELRIVDRGETRSGGLVPLRDVYLRDRGETLLFQCGVSVALAKRIAEAVPGAVVIEEPFAGELTDGAADRVADEVAPGKPRCTCDAVTPCHRVNAVCPGPDDGGEDTDLFEPDAGEPVG